MFANNRVCGLNVCFGFFVFDMKGEVMATFYRYFHLKAGACLLVQRWSDSRMLRGSSEKQNSDLEVMLK